MGFDLVSFLPKDYHVELVVIVCVMRYPYLRVLSGRNIVQLHLFPDTAHVLFSFPFIPVILATTTHNNERFDVLDDNLEHSQIDV